MSAVARGRGGSGKSSGGSSGSSPVEAPNTLQSKAIARVIDLISEGEIMGLVDGLKSIYFNDTPLQNDDGSFNFDGVSVVTTPGTPDQAPLLGFSDVETETAVGTAVTAAISVTRTISDTLSTSARVTIELPTLSVADPTTGDLNPTSVQIAIDVKPNGGSFVETINDVISGKTTSPYERAYRFTLSGSGPWDIRVRRITADSTTVNLQNATTFQSFTAIKDFQLSYPNSALIGVAVDAQQFGTSIPTRTYDVYGIKISVPSNYDPPTRVYTGIWDGTFKTAWSDNPAWVFYDLIVNARYGLGQFITAASVDKFALYAIAQYCDGLVPDGSGGTEPRCTFNGVIASSDDAMKVLVAFAGMFRGMLYWGPGVISVAADMPADAVKVLAPANVVDGTFNYAGASLKARHTFANVSWTNPDNGYVPDIEPVEGDGDEISKWGWRPANVVAFGCTSRGQANRFGRWLLDSEKNESETASWSASFDQADLLPGEIVKIADPAYSGVDFGGRIAAVAGGGLSVTLDRPITIEAGKTYTLSIVLADDTVADRAVTNGGIGSTSVLTFAPALSPLPLVNAMWVITSSTVAPRTFRVVSRIENDKNLFAFSAILHDPTKYARIEQNITLVAPSYTTLPSGALAAPTSLTATECITLVSGSVPKAKVVLSWVAAVDARVVRYEINVKPPGQDWQPAIPSTSSALSVDLIDLTAGIWGFRVRSVDTLGQVSPVWLTIEAQTLDGLLLPPADIANLRSSFVDSTTNLDWDEVKDLRPHRYEIRKGSSWNNGLFIGDLAHPPFATVGDDTYWIATYIGPDTGPRTYSLSPQDIAISGSLLAVNIIASFDEKGSGWTGTFTSGAGIDASNIRTGGSGDITAETDVTLDPDILDLGDQQNGTYTIPTAHRIFIGRVAPCRVMIDYSGQGAPVGQDITTEADITLDPDITGSASSRFIEVYPEIRLSLDGSTFGPWQRFSSGVYSAWGYDARMQLQTTDPSTIAYCTGFTFAVDVPDRNDHQTALAISAGGTAITYRPDGAGSNAAFNGGPNSAATPNIQVNIRNAQTGDIAIRSSETLAGFTLQITNGGVGVARIVDLVIRGY